MHGPHTVSIKPWLDSTSIAASATQTQSDWHATGTYTHLLVNFEGADSFDNTLQVLWSNDETNTLETETMLVAGTRSVGYAMVPVKAAFCKLQFVNNDAAAAHVLRTVRGILTRTYFEPRNVPLSVFVSAERTVDTNSADQTNTHWKGARLVLHVTSVSGSTPTLDVKLQQKDLQSQQYVDIPGAAFPQKTASSVDDLTVYPGIAETANETVSDVLPHTWRAVADLGATTSAVTFSLGGSYIL